jgi:hypothetical protein
VCMLPGGPVLPRAQAIEYLPEKCAALDWRKQILRLSIIFRTDFLPKKSCSNPRSPLYRKK